MIASGHPHHRQPRQRNPVATAPLLRKGGPHGKGHAALRRAHRQLLGQCLRMTDLDWASAPALVGRDTSRRPIQPSHTEWRYARDGGH